MMVQRDPIMSEMEVMLMSMLQSFITAFLNPEPTIILEILSGIVFDQEDMTWYLCYDFLKSWNVNI